EHDLRWRSGRGSEGQDDRHRQGSAEVVQVEQHHPHPTNQPGEEAVRHAPGPAPLGVVAAVPPGGLWRFGGGRGTLAAWPTGRTGGLPAFGFRGARWWGWWRP